MGAASAAAVKTPGLSTGFGWAPPGPPRYVTSCFTTFLVFLLLLNANPQDSAFSLDERLLETVLGVGLAYVFGLGLPALIERRKRFPV